MSGTTALTFGGTCSDLCGDAIKQMFRHRAKIFMRLDQGMTCYLGNFFIIINRILNEMKS